MAEIACDHGIDLEIAAFEGWDAAGRTFDRVTLAQAWYWLDRPAATVKAGCDHRNLPYSRRRQAPRTSSASKTASGTISQ